MANNRLYIGNPITKQYLMISKGFGSGWSGIRNLEMLEKFILEEELIPESDVGMKTALFLFTEYNLEIINNKEWKMYRG